MSNPLKAWMQATTHEQKLRLARYADTTLATLRQIAGGYRNNGKVSTSPELARRIEKATIRLDGPQIMREELCTACAKCDLAKIARGTK